MVDWFQVDKDGLAKLLERKGKEFAVAELLSNAWDQNTTEVVATLQPFTGGKKNLYELVVTDDDPTGFSNLAHAYTLFAESAKKGEATKRGRFNLGEKLVLAVCIEASILSVSGGVRFDASGRHEIRKGKREKGSEFRGLIKMTAEEYEASVAFVRTLIPPQGIRTTFNGETLQARRPKATFRMSLETHVADAEGILKRSTRVTDVEVFEPLADEVPSLYEMGIPVVETNDKWHINVHQKLPLSFERDNVPPAYLRKLRAETLNRLFAEVKGADVSTTWVKAASEAPEAKPEAVRHVLDEMFGEKRVIFDPSDMEANKLAVSQGYTIISPRSLSSGQWDNVREHKLALPAGQVTPSPKVQSEAALNNESAFLKQDKWTPGLKNVASFCQELAAAIGIGNIRVNFTSGITDNYLACYGQKQLVFSVGRLGYAWFNNGITAKVLDLIIHELAHDYSGDHLSSDYHDAQTDLGARITMLALSNPDLFARHGAVVLEGYHTLRNM